MVKFLGSVIQPTTVPPQESRDQKCTELNLTLPGSLTCIMNLQIKSNSQIYTTEQTHSLVKSTDDCKSATSIHNKLIVKVDIAHLQKYHSHQLSANHSLSWTLNVQQLPSPDTTSQQHKISHLNKNKKIQRAREKKRKTRNEKEWWTKEFPVPIIHEHCLKLTKLNQCTESRPWESKLVIFITAVNLCGTGDTGYVHNA